MCVVESHDFSRVFSVAFAISGCLQCYLALYRSGEFPAPRRFSGALHACMAWSVRLDSALSGIKDGDIRVWENSTQHSADLPCSTFPSISHLFLGPSDTHRVSIAHVSYMCSVRTLYNTQSLATSLWIADLHSRYNLYESASCSRYVINGSPNIIACPLCRSLGVECIKML